MSGDDVADGRLIGGVGRDGREGDGAVRVMQGVCSVGDVEGSPDRAARVTRGRLPDDPDVGRQEGVVRGVVVLVRPDADEVVIVSELWVILEQVALRDAEATPA